MAVITPEFMAAFELALVELGGEADTVQIMEHAVKRCAGIDFGTISDASRALRRMEERGKVCCFSRTSKHVQKRKRGLTSRLLWRLPTFKSATIERHFFVRCTVAEMKSLEP